MKRSRFPLLLLLLTVSAVFCAPPGRTGNTVDEEVIRPVHLEGIPLERDGDLNKDFRQEILLGGEGGEDEEDVKELIKKMFSEADTNGDGFLSSSELETRIVNNTLAHLADSQREVIEAMKKIDWNGDKMVSWDEYEMHQASKRRPGIGEKAEAASAKEEQERKEFTRADEDHNGLLDEREWLGFLHPEHSKSSLMEMAADILKSFDANKDGVLSREEFVEIPGEVEDRFAAMEEEDKKKRAQEFDEEMDTNRDGRVTVEEIYEYVNPKNPQHARREVNEIISLADDDGDKRLSLQELLDRDWFVRSSALIDANRRLHDDL